MEEDLNELKRDLEDFCKKYNVTVEARTYLEGRFTNGEIANPKVSLKVLKY